jgi:hypothetical protein
MMQFAEDCGAQASIGVGKYRAPPSYLALARSTPSFPILPATVAIALLIVAVAIGQRSSIAKGANVTTSPPRYGPDWIRRSAREGALISAYESRRQKQAGIQLSRKVLSKNSVYVDHLISIRTHIDTWGTRSLNSEPGAGPFSQVNDAHCTRHRA